MTWLPGRPWLAMLAFACASPACADDDAATPFEGRLDVVDPTGERAGTCMFLVGREGGDDLTVDFNSVSLDIDGVVQEPTCVLLVVRVDGDPFWMAGPNVDVELDHDQVRSGVGIVEEIVAPGTFDLVVFDVDDEPPGDEPLFEGTIEARDVNPNRILVLVRGS